MHRLHAVALCLLVAGGAAVPALAGPPRVVTDIPPVQSLVARVMDGIGTPEMILPPGASPHGHAMRPSEAMALARAELVIWVGRDLTPWLGDAVHSLAADAAELELLEVPGTLLLAWREGARFAPHTDPHSGAGAAAGQHGAEDAQGHDHAGDGHAGHAAQAGHDGHDAHADDDAHDAHADHDGAGHDGDADAGGHAPGAGPVADDGHAPGGAEVAALDFPHGHGGVSDHAHAHADAHDVDAGIGHDDHGHTHAGVDPHAWLDPANARVWLVAIAAELSRLDPANAARYAANAKAGVTELLAQEARIAARLSALPAGRFLLFHDASHYFEARFRVEAIGALSPSDATGPGPRRLAEIREMLVHDGIRCAFAEPQFASDRLERLVAGTRTRIVVLDPLGASLVPGPGLYPALIDGIAAAVVDCLG